jgi:hypothetical protein
VFTGYGQTEVSAATTLTLPGDPVELVAETIGREKLGGVAAPPGFGGVLARYRPGPGAAPRGGGPVPLTVIVAPARFSLHMLGR